MLPVFKIENMLNININHVVDKLKGEIYMHMHRVQKPNSVSRLASRRFEFLVSLIQIPSCDWDQLYN